jgi:hypothetical protein
MHITQLTFDPGHKRLRTNGWEKVAGIIPESYKQRYLALYETNKDNKIEDKTTVYSTPLSELPSYKLKNYIAENKLNIKTARKFDKLDAVIISDLFIRENYTDLKNYNWDQKTKQYYHTPQPPENLYIIPIDVIVDNPKLSKYRDQTTQYGYSNDILKNRKGEVYTHYVITEKNLNDWIQFDSNFEFIKKHSPIPGLVITNHHGNTKACKNINFFLNLIDSIEKYNLKVIYDTSVNNDINQGVVVDFDMYQTLYNMLNSSDVENWEMAREIVANCEYDTSKPYLMHLYCSFSQLRKANGSANYQFLKKKLNKEVDLPNHYGRNGSPSFTAITKHLVTKFPTYNQVFLDCFKYQVNTFIGKDVIKEITSY